MHDNKDERKKSDETSKSAATERNRTSSKSENVGCNNNKQQQIKDERNLNKIDTFKIEQILAAPKVPRGRRPNAKYPRVQACKSMSPYGLGMFPLFPITQPVGFTIKVDSPAAAEGNEDNTDCM